MERLTLLQQRALARHAEEERQHTQMLARETARQARSLVLPHIARLSRSIADTPTVTFLGYLPVNLIVNDHHVEVTTRAITDPIATLAWQIPGLDVMFVLMYRPQAAQLTLLWQRYRMRGTMSTTDPPEWLPPGDYIASQVLAEAHWANEDAMETAIDTMFAHATIHKDLVHTAHQQVHRDRRRRRMMYAAGRTAGSIGTALMLLLLLLVVLWCAYMVYMIPRGLGGA